ncbi:MAG: tetratricopeptide repeat protein, partial [Candidatus Aureabacteria bacterium]|nr:tetratricopeptide repeat protein [Candidatus Auribacterota bacterium]
MKRFLRSIPLLLLLCLFGCGARDERHYELALRYKESGDYDKAIVELQSAIRINPRASKAYNQLGVLYGKVSLYDKAAEQFRRAVEVDPAFAAGYYNLGVLYQSHMNKPAEAVTAYRHYVALVPEGQKVEAVRKIIDGLMQRPEVQSALAESSDEQLVIAKGHEERGDYAQAIEAYGKAIARDPRGSSRVHLQIAKLYEEKLQKPADALRHYQAYLDANINAPDASEVMACVGRVREKIAPAVTPGGSPDEKLAGAEELLKNRQTASAIELLIQARDAAPGNERAHDMLAEAYMDAGDLKAAEKEYEWLKSHQRDFPYTRELLQVYTSLGDAALNAGRNAESEERFIKAIELAPNDGMLHLRLARALAAAGKSQRALEEATTARTLAPGEVGEKEMAELHLGSARFLSSQGQYELAGQSLDEAARLQPGLDLGKDTADMCAGRGRLAQKEGRYAAAEKEYAKALQIDPARIPLRRELAAVYESLGRYDRALEELETVARSGEEGVSAYRDMGRICETYKADNAL